MPALYAAWRDWNRYSVVVAKSADEVWDRAAAKGVQLVGVTKLKLKSTKTVTVSDLTAE